MAKHGKKFTAAAAQVGDRSYTIEDAIPHIQKVKYAKFDETVELTCRLGVDPKHADQMVRGTVVLPHGLGKSKKVRPEKEPGSTFSTGLLGGSAGVIDHDTTGAQIANDPLWLVA